MGVAIGGGDLGSARLGGGLSGSGGVEGQCGVEVDLVGVPHCKRTVRKLGGGVVVE